MVSRAADLFHKIEGILLDAGIESSGFEAKVLFESVFGKDAYIKLMAARVVKHTIMVVALDSMYRLVGVGQASRRSTYAFRMD